MIKTCEECWETYDTERKGCNEYFCAKCFFIEGGDGFGLD